MLVGTSSHKTSRAALVAWESVIAKTPFEGDDRHIVEGARLSRVTTIDQQLAALLALCACAAARAAVPAAARPGT